LRWLLVKDVQILRRSPLLVGLLVIYPIVIAVLIGLALSKGPDRPRVAFLSLVPSTENNFSIGGQPVDAAIYNRELFKSIDPILVRTRDQALQKVRNGEALAALIIPRDILTKLSSGLEQPTIEVIYNAEDPVKARYVETTIKSQLADANAALSRKYTEVAGGYLNLLLEGGAFRLFGRDIDILGLKNARAILEGARPSLPPRQRPALDQVVRFATFAIDNLGLSDAVLRSVASPVKVRRTILAGKRTPLDAFAVAVAVTLSLMFITVLLAAGMLALEREEHAFSRLVRGLVSRLALLTEKIALAAACAFAVTLVMLMGLGIFVSLDWGRFPLWLAALAGGAISFAALGVAIGGIAREVRAASLLAFLLALPIAFLALVPSGAVSAGLYDVIRVISALFPFKAALQGVDAALNGSSPGVGESLAHLAVLALAFGAIGRVALRRFA